MKTYRITPEFYITAHGATVDFEFNGTSVHDITDETVAQLLNILIGLVYTPTSLFDKKSVILHSVESRYYELTFKHTSEDDYRLVLTVHLCNRKEAFDISVTSGSIVKFMNVLTQLLASLCEEGV